MCKLKNSGTKNILENTFSAILRGRTHAHSEQFVYKPSTVRNMLEKEVEKLHRVYPKIHVTVIWGNICKHRMLPVTKINTYHI